MNLKTYQASSMAKALTMVKQDIGEDAVILHTRSFKRGGIMGIGSKQVVEITAAKDINVVPHRMRKRQPVDRKKPATANNLLNKAYHPNAGANNAPLASQVSQQPPQSPSFATVASSLPVPTSQPDPQLASELKQIRQLVSVMLDKQPQSIRKDLPKPLFDQYLALLEQEMTVELADEVVESVKQKLKANQLTNKTLVREAVSTAVARLVPVNRTPLEQQRPEDGRPLTIALVGPTGVGKTTTIAKLAATFKLKQNLNVALVTIDTYRIAAVDQLKTYADIIQLPVHVALTPLEMKQAIKRCQDADIILIDTAGRSQRDDSKLAELKSFIDAADPHEVHLVLSGTCSQKVLIEAIDRFQEIRTDRIIFTKLDEAVSFGMLLSVIRRVNKQLSFITTGQEVPHQIEPGHGRRLADLILGEAL